MRTIEKALKKQQKLVSRAHAKKMDSVIENIPVEQFKMDSVIENIPVEQLKNEKEIKSESKPKHNILENEQINTSVFEQERIDIAAGYKAYSSDDKNPAGYFQGGQSQTVEIDIERLKSLGFMTSLESNTLLNEEFREIKRPLLQNIKGKSAHKIEKANLIQVTSSVQGEGKTFTSVNLAIAIAMEMDHTVLLVDADVIKSSVSKTLGIESETGLTDYLKGDVSNLSEVMLKTSIPKLSVLPAGSRQDLSTELLNSDFMDNLFNELSGRYKNRVVIIDSPPLLETNESRVIAHKVGQIVFVAEHNKTTQASIKSALSLLEPEMVIGLVINKNRSGSKSQYGYGSDAK